MPMSAKLPPNNKLELTEDVVKLLQTGPKQLIVPVPDKLSNTTLSTDVGAEGAGKLARGLVALVDQFAVLPAFQSPEPLYQ